MNLKVRVSLLTQTTVTMRRRPRLAEEDCKTDTYPVVGIFDVTIFKKYVYYSVDWLGYPASWERVERVQAIRFVRVYWRSALLGDYETRKNALLSSMYMHTHKIPIYDFEGAFFEDSDDENEEAFDPKCTSYLREEFDPDKINDILDVAFSDEGSLMYKISGRYIELQNQHKTVWIEYTPEIRPKVQYDFWTKALNSGAIRYFQLLFKLEDQTLCDALVKHAARSGFEFNDLTVKKVRGRPCDLKDFWTRKQSRLFDEVLTSNRADILSCILEKFCVKTKSGYLSTTQYADIASTFTLLQSKASDNSTTVHFVDYMESSYLTFRHYNNIFYRCYEQYDVWFMKDHSIAIKEDEARKNAAKTEKIVPENSSDSEFEQSVPGQNKSAKKSSSRITRSNSNSNKRRRSTRSCRKLNYNENEDEDDSSIDSTYDAREDYVSDDSSENDSETDPWPHCYDYNPYPDTEHTCGMERSPSNNLEPSFRICNNKYCHRRRSRAECTQAIDELAKNTTIAELLGGGTERVNKEFSSRLCKYGLSIMRDLLHLTRVTDRHFCAPDLRDILTVTSVIKCDNFKKKLREFEKELNRATDYHERVVIMRRIRQEVKSDNYKRKEGHKHRKKKRQKDAKDKEITRRRRIRKKLRKKVVERYLLSRALMERCLKSGTYLHRKTMFRSSRQKEAEQASDEIFSSAIQQPAQKHSFSSRDVPAKPTVLAKNLNAEKQEKMKTNVDSLLGKNGAQVISSRDTSAEPYEKPNRPDRELPPLTADFGSFEEVTTCLQVEPSTNSLISSEPFVIDVHSDTPCPGADNVTVDPSELQCEAQRASHSCISTTPQFESLSPLPMTEKCSLYLSLSPSQTLDTLSTDQMQLIPNDQNLRNVYLQETEENDDVIAWETLYKLIESVACTYPLAFVDTLTSVDEFDHSLTEELLRTLRSRSIPLENSQQTVEWASSLLGKRKMDSSLDEGSFQSKHSKLQGEGFSTAVPLELLFTTEIDRHKNYVYIDSENQSYIVYVSIFHFLASNAFAQGETIYQNCYRLLYPDFYGKPSTSHPRKRRVLVRTSKFEFVEIWKNRYVEAHSSIAKANLNDFADWNWCDARPLEDEEGGYRISHKYEIGVATSEDRLLYAILQRQFPDNVIYTTDQAFTLNYLSSTNFMRRFCHFILKIFNLAHFCVLKEIVTITDESILSDTYTDWPFTDVTYIDANRVNDLRAIGEVVRFYAEKYNRYSQLCYDGTPNQLQSYSCNRFSSPRDDSDQSNWFEKLLAGEERPLFSLEPNQLVHDGQVPSTSFSPMPVLRAVSQSVPSISSSCIVELGEAPQLEHISNLGTESVAKGSTIPIESSSKHPQTITSKSDSHQSDAYRIFRFNTNKTPAEYDRLSSSSHDVEIISEVHMQQSLPSTSNASQVGIHQGLGDTFQAYSDLSVGILEEPSYENYRPSYSTPYRYEVFPSTPPSPLLQQVSGLSSVYHSPTTSLRIISNGTVKPFQLAQSSSLYCRPRRGEIIFEVAPYSRIRGKDVLECQKCKDQVDMLCELHVETVIKENDLSMLRIQFLSPENPSTSNETSTAASDRNDTLLMIYREYERMACAQENEELSSSEAIYDKRVFLLNVTTATRKVKKEIEISVYTELIEDELFRASVKIILTDEMKMTGVIQKSIKKLLKHIFTKDLFNDCERVTMKARLLHKSLRRATSSRGSRTPYRTRSSTCSKPKIYTPPSFPRVSSMESVVKMSPGYRGSPASKALCRFRALYSSKVSNQPKDSPALTAKASKKKPVRRRAMSEAQITTKSEGINRRRTYSEMEASKSPIQSGLDKSAPSTMKRNTKTKKITMRSWKQPATFSRPAPTPQPYPLNFSRVYTSAFQSLAQSKSSWSRKSSKPRLAKRSCGFINIASEHIKPIPRYKPKLAIDKARARNFLTGSQCSTGLPHPNVADSSVSQNGMLLMDQCQLSTSSGMKWIAKSPTYEKPVSKALARLRALYTGREESYLSPSSSSRRRFRTTRDSQKYAESCPIYSNLQNGNLTSSTTDMNMESNDALQNSEEARSCRMYPIMEEDESTCEQNGSRSTENQQPSMSSSNVIDTISESESDFVTISSTPSPEGNSATGEADSSLGYRNFGADELMVCEDGQREPLNDEPIDVITIASTPERVESPSLFNDSPAAQIESNDINVRKSSEGTVLQELVYDSDGDPEYSPALPPLSVERHEEIVISSHPASPHPNLVPNTDQQPGPRYTNIQSREPASMAIPAWNIVTEQNPLLTGTLDFSRLNFEQPLIASSPTLMQNFVYASSVVAPAEAFNSTRYQLHNFRTDVIAYPAVTSSTYSYGSMGNLHNFTGTSAPNIGSFWDWNWDYRETHNPSFTYARIPVSMSFETLSLTPLSTIHVPVTQPAIPPTTEVTSWVDPISVTITHNESSSPTTCSPSSVAEIPNDAKPLIIFAPVEHIQGFCLLDSIASARERVKQSLIFQADSTSWSFANESGSSSKFREEFGGGYMSPAPTESSSETNYINLILGPTILPMTLACRLNFQTELSLLEDAFKVVKPTCFSSSAVRKVLEDYLEDVPNDHNLLSAEVLSSTSPEYSSLMTGYGFTKMTLEALQAVKRFRFEDSPNSPEHVLANVMSNLMIFDRTPAKILSKNLKQQSISKNRREVITLHKFINGKILLETNLFELMPNGNSFTFTTFSLKLDNSSLTQSIFPRFYNITSLLRVDEQEVLFNFYRSKFLRFLQSFGNNSINDTAEPTVEIQSPLELEEIAKSLAADSRIHPTSITFFLYDNSPEDVGSAQSTRDIVPSSSENVLQPRRTPQQRQPLEHSQHQQALLNQLFRQQQLLLQQELSSDWQQQNPQLERIPQKSQQNLLYMQQLSEHQQTSQLRQLPEGQQILQLELPPDMHQGQQQIYPSGAQKTSEQRQPQEREQTPQQQQAPNSHEDPKKKISPARQQVQQKQDLHERQQPSELQLAQQEQHSVGIQGSSPQLNCHQQHQDHSERQQPSGLHQTSGLQQAHQKHQQPQSSSASKDFNPTNVRSNLDIMNEDKIKQPIAKKTSYTVGMYSESQFLEEGPPTNQDHTNLSIVIQDVITRNLEINPDGCGKISLRKLISNSLTIMMPSMEKYIAVYRYICAIMKQLGNPIIAESFINRRNVCSIYIIDHNNIDERFFPFFISRSDSHASIALPAYMSLDHSHCRHLVIEYMEGCRMFDIVAGKKFKQYLGKYDYRDIYQILHLAQEFSEEEWQALDIKSIPTVEIIKRSSAVVESFKNLSLNGIRPSGSEEQSADHEQTDQQIPDEILGSVSPSSSISTMTPIVSPSHTEDSPSPHHTIIRQEYLEKLKCVEVFMKVIRPTVHINRVFTFMVEPSQIDDQSDVYSMLRIATRKFVTYIQAEIPLTVGLCDNHAIAFAYSILESILISAKNQQSREKFLMGSSPTLINYRASPTLLSYRFDFSIPIDFYHVICEMFNLTEFGKPVRAEFETVRLSMTLDLFGFYEHPDKDYIHLQAYHLCLSSYKKIIHRALFHFDRDKIDPWIPNPKFVTPIDKIRSCITARENLFSVIPHKSTKNKNMTKFLSQLFLEGTPLHGPNCYKQWDLSELPYITEYNELTSIMELDQFLRPFLSSSLTAVKQPVRRPMNLTIIAPVYKPFEENDYPPLTFNNMERYLTIIEEIGLAGNILEPLGACQPEGTVLTSAMLNQVVALLIYRAFNASPVALDAFFAHKFKLSKEQWVRLMEEMTENASRYKKRFMRAIENTFFAKYADNITATVYLHPKPVSCSEQLNSLLNFVFHAYQHVDLLLKIFICSFDFPIDINILLTIRLRLEHKVKHLYHLTKDVYKENKCLNDLKFFPPKGKCYNHGHHKETLNVLLNRLESKLDLVQLPDCSAPTWDQNLQADSNIALFWNEFVMELEHCSSKEVKPISLDETTQFSQPFYEEILSHKVLGFDYTTRTTADIAATIVNLYQLLYQTLMRTAPNSNIRIYKIGLKYKIVPMERVPWLTWLT